MQKQKAARAKTIYMSLRKQGQHLHLSHSLIFLHHSQFHPSLPGKTLFSEALGNCLLCLKKPFSSPVEYVQPVIILYPLNVLGKLCIQWCFYHNSQEGMLSPETHSCNDNTTLWLQSSLTLKPVNSQQYMQCIKGCVCAHASVQPIQLFLSVQQ